MIRGRWTVLILASSVALAQSAKAPAISVVSIKPSDPAISAMNNHFPPGRFTLIGYSLMSLIESAYSVREYQVLDAPGWMSSERWILDGELTEPVRMFAYMQLLQPVLADRYHLKIRHETRSMPIYSVVIAKGGLKLQRPAENAKQGTRYGNMIVDHKYDVRRLASDLSGNLNMPVIDKTGEYDMHLEWTPDPARLAFGDVRNPADIPAPDPNRPEIFTAIREQLGLELKAEKGPVDVLVIEHAERPSAN